MQDVTRLTTFGHGTLPIGTFLELVRSAQIQRIVDIRAMPKSRRNPQFARESMQEWVVGAGLSYRWDPRLGGFRKSRDDSKNVALRHPAFRGYADYMQTPPFWLALDELLEESARINTAIMCSESLWWRCHRRLVADAAVLARAVEVVDLNHDGSLVTHRHTEGARLQDGFVVYDVVEPRITFADK